MCLTVHINLEIIILLQEWEDFSLKILNYDLYLPCLVAGVARKVF